MPPVLFRTALADRQGDVIDRILEPCDLTTLPVDLVNELLVSVIHHHHQRVVRALQLAHGPSTVSYAASPSSAPFRERSGLSPLRARTI